jgi:hypothetical protein
LAGVNGYSRGSFVNHMGHNASDIGSTLTEPNAQSASRMARIGLLPGPVRLTDRPGRRLLTRDDGFYLDVRQLVKPMRLNILAARKAIIFLPVSLRESLLIGCR